MQIKRPQSKQPIPPNAKRVFKGVVFDTYQWQQKMFNGTKRTFEKVKKLDTVSIFPVLPDGKIIIAEQKQPGTKPYWGVACGRVDRGEGVLSAAKRELLEETGYEAKTLILWDAHHPMNKVDWVVYTFIAKGLKKVAGLNLDGGEKIKARTVSLNKLINLATTKYETFDQPEVLPKFFEAKISMKKKKELEKLFKPIEKN